jgi:hypothetical protein
METKLQASANALKECESKLQQELNQRLRQEEALVEAKRKLQEKAQGTTVEVDKLKAELEEERLERKRMEGDIAQSRYASLDSARAGLAMVNRLRSQVREPVDGLMQSTRRLLEAELEEDVKKQVESLLENALAIQRTLQEAATLNACTPRTEDLKPGEPESSRSANSAPGQPGEKLQA